MNWPKWRTYLLLLNCRLVHLVHHTVQSIRPNCAEISLRFVCALPNCCRAKGIELWKYLDKISPEINSGFMLMFFFFRNCALPVKRVVYIGGVSRTMGRRGADPKFKFLKKTFWIRRCKMCHLNWVVDFVMIFARKYSVSPLWWLTASNFSIKLEFCIKLEGKWKKPFLYWRFKVNLSRRKHKDGSPWRFPIGDP